MRTTLAPGLAPVDVVPVDLGAPSISRPAVRVVPLFEDTLDEVRP